MDPLTIFQLAIQYGPLVKQAIDIASSNDDLASRINSINTPLAQLLGGIGAKLFPKAAPALHTVGAVIAAFDPNFVKWLQGSLNALVEPSPNLVVDGIYGPLTRAAVEKLQTKLGLKVDGIAGQITRTAIEALLSNKALAAAGQPALKIAP